MKTLTLSYALILVVFTSCGAVSLGVGDAGLTGAAKVCNGIACECTANQTCTFDTCSASTASCEFKCDENATCAGTAGPAARVQCNGKACTHTVGEGSNVQCTAGTCTIACTGACNVTGAGQLSVTCQGGTKTAAGCQ